VSVAERDEEFLVHAGGGQRLQAEQGLAERLVAVPAGLVDVAQALLIRLADFGLVAVLAEDLVVEAASVDPLAALLEFLRLLQERGNVGRQGSGCGSRPEASDPHEKSQRAQTYQQGALSQDTPPTEAGGGPQGHRLPNLEV